jgi:hypothetical protein
MIELGGSGPISEQAMARALARPTAERAEGDAPELLKLLDEELRRAADAPEAGVFGASEALGSLRERLLDLRAKGDGRRWQSFAQQAADWLGGAGGAAPWSGAPESVCAARAAKQAPPLAAPAAAGEDPVVAAVEQLERVERALDAWGRAPAWSADLAWAWSTGALPGAQGEARERWRELFARMGPAGRSLWVAWLRGFAQGAANPASLGAWGAVGEAFSRALPPASFGSFGAGFLALRLLPLWAALPNLAPRDAASLKAANAWMAVCAGLLGDPSTAGERARDLLGLAEALSRGESGLPLAHRYGRLTRAFWAKGWMDSAWGPNLARLGAVATLIWAIFHGGWAWGAPVALFVIFWGLQSWRMARALWIGRPGWEGGWPARAVAAAWVPQWRDPAPQAGEDAGEAGADEKNDATGAPSA